MNIRVHPEMCDCTADSHTPAWAVGTHTGSGDGELLLVLQQWKERKRMKGKTTLLMLS